MREAAVLRAPDKHESGLEPLYKYYDQLAAMESKLPISDSQIRIKFTWYDAFAKESFFSGATKESMHSSAFERACLLFNVAALQSQIAKGQNFDSDEGLKTAVKHFQGAAGVFYQVKEMVYVQFSKVPLPDMTAEMLGALAATMLAQAQESLYYKTTLARMKNQICAKVAAQAGDLYSEAARLVRDPNVSKKLDKKFVAVVSAKHPYFHGVADYHEGLACKEDAKYGEAIARFRLAYGGMSEATKRGEQFFRPGDVFSRIQRDLAQTEKDNNVIYSDLIPELSKIPPVGRAALAKPVPLALPASNHQDLFAKVVPLTVHNAIATYESRKDALIQAEVGKLREASQILNGVLSSLNLPAAIEDVSGNEVPPSLLEKAKAVRENGGVLTVKTMFENLPELQQRNKEILDEVSLKITHYLNSLVHVYDCVCVCVAHAYSHVFYVILYTDLAHVLYNPCIQCRA
jgi:programmed cell death 6-interacting protein